MKIALCLSLVATAAAFSQQSRREVFAKIAAGAAFVPVAANAAAGESPRFSVFGIIGEGDSMSEGAAYGTDQSSPLYSPYSVYGGGEGALFNPSDPSVNARKKAVIAESKKRLTKLDAYIAKKKWSDVTTELSRYMYETRGAVRGLSSTPEQKAAAEAFFKAIEATNIAARLKKQDDAKAAAADAIAKLEAFTAKI